MTDLHDIGILDEIEDKLPTLGLFEVDGDGPLVAVHGGKVVGNGTARLVPRLLLAGHHPVPCVILRRALVYVDLLHVLSPRFLEVDDVRTPLPTASTFVTSAP